MTSEQRAMCFGEWKKCWFAIVQASGGRTTADERGVRMGVTAKALGKPRSWSAFWSNGDVDRLLAVMWAIARPGDLAAQIRQLDQPLTRVEGSSFAQALLAELGIAEAGRDAYLDGIARRIHKRPLADLSADQWRDVLAALNHSRLHKAGVRHHHGPKKAKPSRTPAGATEAAEGHVNPF